MCHFPDLTFTRGSNASAKNRLHLNQTSQAENCRRVYILKTEESQKAKETPDSQ